MDPRINEICDYISFNWYEEYCSRELLADIVSEISEYSSVIISEFGLETDEDVPQTKTYLDAIDIFRNLDIRHCIAWYWRADYNLGAQPPPGTGFNLAKNVDGDPRPAFYIVVSARVER